MFSSEGEKVQFSESISTSAARGAVEKWLLQVQDVMAISLRDVIEQARDVSQHLYSDTYTYILKSLLLEFKLVTLDPRRMLLTLVSNG